MAEDIQSENLPEFEEAQAKTRSGRSRGRKLIVAGGVFLLLCLCLAAIGALVGDEPAEVAEETAAGEPAEVIERAAEEEAEVVVDVTDTAQPPTATPAPTDRPEATATPSPTDTPAPTNTPAPTDTPTPVPTPVVLSGSGDQVLELNKSEEPALMHITGNQAGRHFALTSYDADGQQLDLLVNTTEPYEGVRPIDFGEGEHTARLEVTGTGDWMIELMPLSMIERVEVPGTVSGEGDYVFATVTQEPDTAHITGNNAARHFAVLAYGSGFPDLLVNTTDPYDGTVIVDSDSFIFEVTATGPWTVEFDR